MVRRNPDAEDNIHAPSVVLEASDEKAIEAALADAPVEIEEMKISNPSNDLEGLYILIASADRDDLYEDATKAALREAAGAVGYNGARMYTGNLPSQKEPRRYDDWETDYYTLAVWFKHRR